MSRAAIILFGVSDPIVRSRRIRLFLSGGILLGNRVSAGPHSEVSLAVHAIRQKPLSSDWADHLHGYALAHAWCTAGTEIWFFCRILDGSMGLGSMDLRIYGSMDLLI